jgi:hypothetical protein
VPLTFLTSPNNVSGIFIIPTYRCTGSKLVWWHAWHADVIAGGYRMQVKSGLSGAVRHPDLASGEDSLDGQR